MSKRRWFSMALITGICWFPCMADAAADGGMRVWKSAAGSEVKAVFERVQNGMIVLRGEDGRLMSISPDALAEADRELARQLAAGYNKEQAVRPPVAGGASVAPKQPAAGPAEATAAVPHPLLKPGETSGEIVAPGKDNWSYHVYAPKSFSADRKYPVMFIMSPSGGGPATLKRYLPGAERNHWLLAVSVQSKNNFNGSGAAIEAMVKDVMEKLPVDKDRLYASGFSGGSRMAAGLAVGNKPKLAGVIACGAGSPLQTIPGTTTAFGLCGSNCFNRWDMACSFDKIKNQDSRLMFFPGNHDWAGDALLSYAMTWLNATYLRDAPLTSTHLTREKQLLETRLRADIAANIESDPERAYEFARCLAQLGPRSTAGMNRDLAAVKKNPKAALYERGLDEMDRFVARNFATSPMDYANANNGNPKTRKAADELAETYKDTSLAVIFKRMGEKSAK